MEVKETKAHHIHAMRQSVKHMLKSQKKNTSVKQGKANVQATKLFLPFELVDAAYLTKLEKEQKAKIKQEASEVKKEAKVAKRAARTCFAPDCEKYTNKPEGATGWSCCRGCGSFFCKIHKHLHAVHEQEYMNEEYSV